MTRAVLLSLIGLPFLSAGCTHEVFNRPVALSTKTDAVRIVKRLGKVSVGRCDAIVVIVPIAHDPATAYDELLGKARAAGGNAVIDVELRGDSGGFLMPLFVRECSTLTGTAAIVDGAPPPPG